MNEIMKSLCKTIDVGITTAALYTVLLLGTQGTAQFTSPRIVTQPQLEWTLKAEREKLKDMIDENITIDAKLVESEKDCAKCRKFSELRYEIVLSGRGANESFLRHELYHIAGKHFCQEVGKEKGPGEALKYFFLDESRAQLYATLGWRL